MKFSIVVLSNHETEPRSLVFGNAVPGKGTVGFGHENDPSSEAVPTLWIAYPLTTLAELSPLLEKLKSEGGNPTVYLWRRGEGSPLVMSMTFTLRGKGIIYNIHQQQPFPPCRSITIGSEIEVRDESELSAFKTACQRDGRGAETCTLFIGEHEDGDEHFFMFKFYPRVVFGPPP